ncbi:hypothetical protein [Methylobacterium sp. ID0610]|uniref:hypothetical protein n=1 Tax=Methylobacterium carpenticola TaxID=3344827 RepID=UPI0036945989
MSNVASASSGAIALVPLANDQHAASAGCGPTIRAVDPRRYDRHEWDSEMARVGGSVRSTHAHLRGLSLKRPWRPTRSFAVTLVGETRPIGYFTLRRKGSVWEFYDGLRLAPEHAHRWDAAMASSLAACGPAIYRYGWTWSPEPSREAALRGIAGVEVLATVEAVVQGIDFANWPSWEAYRAAISQNAKRNARKFEARLREAPVVMRRGARSLVDLWHLVRMRREMYARKGIAFGALGALAGHLANLLACPRDGLIASVRGDERVAAIMRLVEHLETTYYFEGSHIPGEEGAAWYLTLAVLQRAYRAAPFGKFLMGFYIVGDELAEGLIRSRTSLRVTNWPTAIVTFAWQPPAAPATREPDQAALAQHDRPVPRALTPEAA